MIIDYQRSLPDPTVPSLVNCADIVSRTNMKQAHPGTTKSVGEERAWAISHPAPDAAVQQAYLKVLTDWQYIGNECGNFNESAFDESLGMVKADINHLGDALQASGASATTVSNYQSMVEADFSTPGAPPS